MGSSSFPMFGSGGNPTNTFRGSNTGSNQYSSYPMFNNQTPGNTALPTSNPYQVPSASTPTGGPGATVNQLNNPTASSPFPVGSSIGIGGGNRTVPTFDPNFTSQFYQFLQSQMGKGATPFNLSTPLPGGGTTKPGQLSPGLNSVDQSLLNFYNTGSGGPPGMDTLAGFSKGVDTMPEFKAMVAAMNGPGGPIAQQEAMMKGNFAGQGSLAGSEYGNSEALFRTQTAADQNALMAQLTMQGLGMQESAATTLSGDAATFGKDLQGLDQQAINQQLAEFIRTRPEYSPYLNMLFGGATSSPAAIGSKVGVGAAGAAIGSAGSVLSGAADIYTAITDAQSNG